MQITLKQHEIERAVRQYVGKLGVSPANANVSMEFTAGRGDRGLSVTINIDEDGDQDTAIGRVTTDEARAPSPAPAPRNAASRSPTPAPRATPEPAPAVENAPALFGGDTDTDNKEGAAEGGEAAAPVTASNVAKSSLFGG